jgi:hypothetical protein
MLSFLETPIPSHRARLREAKFMATKRNGADAGAGNGSESVRSTSAFLTAPAAASFLASQKMALEATRFWAKRMRAYADQLDVIAGCADPMQLVSAQARFVQRMQEDYAEEGRAVASMVMPNPESAEAARAGETAH